MGERLKGGIVIIGSLFWQDDSEFGNGDDNRKKWREKYLQMDKAIQVHFPLKYGRISEKQETTMCISKKTNNSGVAYFVPFKENNVFSKAESEVFFNAILAAESEVLKNEKNKQFIADYLFIRQPYSVTPGNNQLSNYSEFYNAFYNEEFLRVKNEKEKKSNLSASWLITSIGFNKISTDLKSKIEIAWTNNCKKNSLKTTLYNSKREPFASVAEESLAASRYYIIKSEDTFQPCDEYGNKTTDKVNYEGLEEVSIKINPKIDKKALTEEMSKIKSLVKKNRYPLENTDLKDLPIDNKGVFELNGNWLTPLDDKYADELNKYDYFLTCVLPPSLQRNGTIWTTAKVDLSCDKNRFYFFNNLACGIRTADDYTSILTKGISDYNSFFTLQDRQYSTFIEANQIERTLAFYDGKLHAFSGVDKVFESNKLSDYAKDKNENMRKSFEKFLAHTDYTDNSLKSVSFQKSDGNLVIYHNGEAIWATDHYNEGISSFIIYNSVFCLRKNDNQLINLSSENFQKNGSSGNLSDVYINCKEEIIYNFEFNQGQYLQAGLENNCARLVFDTKGRLLLFKNNKLVWFTKQANNQIPANSFGGLKAKFQNKDGNIVIYNGANVVWASGNFSEKNGPYSLKLSYDAELTIIDGNHAKCWSAKIDNNAWIEYVKYTDKLIK